MKIARSKKLLLVFLVVIDLILKSFFRSTKYYIENSGVSFGLGESGVGLWILLVLALGFIYRQSKTFPVQLMLAGGVSNLLDRLINKKVTDWISLPLIGIHFNMADVYITLGFIWFVINEYKTRKA